MKFTKTALAVAIAGIAAAPMVATADTTLSGIIEINVNGSDIEVEGDDTAGDIAVGTGDVFFGIVAEQELNSGLTGYGSLRLDLDGLSNQSGSAVDSDGGSVKQSPSYDNVYTGIKGGFGDFRIGEIPLAVEYGQVANDIFDVGSEINGGLSYTGTFGPVGVIANFSPENNSDAIGLGAKFGIGGFAVGVGFEDRAESQNLSAGASFTFAGAAISAHYWTKEIGAGIDDDAGESVGNLEDENGIAVQVGYGFGGVSAKLTIATAMGDAPEGVTVGTPAGTEAEAQAIRLDLGYDLGGGLNVSTRITAFTIEDNTYEIEGSTEDQTLWRVQLAKSF